MRRSIAITVLAAAGFAPPARAQTEVEVQVYFGSAQSLPLPITISQSGHPDLRFTAHWDTRPTEPAWYYAWRIGIWRGNRGWRLDHTHHKVYLENPPPEVQRFQITNGFNILSVSRAFRRRHLSYSVGAGPVLAYPINTVRDQPLDEERGFHGFHLSGGSAIGMVTREFPIVGGLAAAVDVRGSLSYVKVPITGGTASVPNAALHLHAGLGYAFGRRR